MARLAWIPDRRALAAAAGGAALLAVALPLPASAPELVAAATGLMLLAWACVSLRRQHRASLTWCPTCRGTVSLSAERCRHCAATLHGSPTAPRDARALLDGASRNPSVPLL
jgi:hypothetical protein